MHSMKASMKEDTKNIWKEYDAAQSANKQSYDMPSPVRIGGPFSTKNSTNNTMFSMPSSSFSGTSGFLNNKAQAHHKQYKSILYKKPSTSSMKEPELKPKSMNKCSYLSQK